MGCLVLAEDTDIGDVVLQLTLSVMVSAVDVRAPIVECGGNGIPTGMAMASICVCACTISEMPVMLRARACQSIMCVCVCV